MLKIDKKDYKEIDNYYIGYVAVKKIANCNNVNSVNPSYVMINEMMVKNKEVSKKYEEVWKGVKKEIETITGGKKVEYGKDFKTISFESNNDLPLNKPIKLHSLTIIIRCVFSEDGKFYPQLFLNEALYELV